MRESLPNCGSRSKGNGCRGNPILRSPYRICSTVFKCCLTGSKHGELFGDPMYVRHRGLGLATPPDSVATALQSASSQTGVPLSLLQSVAASESSYNPNAVDVRPHQGLMQLMPATAKSLGVSNPFDPNQSALGGAHFAKLIRTVRRLEYGSDRVQRRAGGAGFEGSLSEFSELCEYNPFERRIFDGYNRFGGAGCG